ncbi:metallophosphoesterase [Mycoplasma sp. (ex Biomphalaria glabrata)]|uniref:TIGR00282 family metallophosphoesterase n=1 Tax=Mycoplasma sp. (ex Biomphalaria glabrata) TaxID=1749074 RepID=UPI00073A9081|nr:TIGR00282 family metallophosphoesterase [Mycoplasma sp. (ex Biomphalaria glabrata)]ALV23158.1 metallophosphoesterase [Mycoplasma sp. (ex Biomphalaria glabrata)]
MNILIIGDIFGNVGKETIEKYLDIIRKDNNIDFTIANIENLTNGKSIDKKDYQWCCEKKFDVLTSGNHILANREVNELLSTKNNILRPLNMGPHYLGKGTEVFKWKDKSIRVSNLLGKTFIDKSDNPYHYIEEVIKNDNSDLHIIDFHAEATSEKISLAWFLDGKITALYGTHTHVQTADERLLPNGTAFITDIGMTGPYNSIIGVNPDEVISLQRTNIPIRFKNAIGEGIMGCIILCVDNKTNQVIKIKRILITPDKPYQNH